MIKVILGTRPTIIIRSLSYQLSPTTSNYHEPPGNQVLLTTNMAYHNPSWNASLMPTILLKYGYLVLMSYRGCCQNPISQYGSVVEFVSSEFDLFILQKADKVLRHGAYRQNRLQPSCMISYFLQEFQYLQKVHAQSFTTYQIHVTCWLHNG